MGPSGLKTDGFLLFWSADRSQICHLDRGWGNKPEKRHKTQERTRKRERAPGDLRGIVNHSIQQRGLVFDPENRS
jgi:hypothetical protein